MGDTETGADLIAGFTEFALERFLPAVAEALGMALPPLGGISVIPDELMPPSRDAFFRTVAYPLDSVMGSLAPGSQSSLLCVSQQSALMIAMLLEGNTPGLPPDLRREFLDVAKESLLILTHEAVHSLRLNAGVPVAEMAANVSGFGMDAAFEGLTQAVAEEIFDDVLEQSGVVASDPAIAEASSNADHFFVGVADTARYLLRAVSEKSGMPTRELAVQLAARHFGWDAVKYLATTHLEGCGVGDADALSTVIVIPIVEAFNRVDHSVAPLLTATGAVPHDAVVAAHKAGTAAAKAAVTELETLADAARSAPVAGRGLD